MKLDYENQDFGLLDQAVKHLRKAAIPAGPSRQLVMETSAAMERPSRRLAPLTAIMAAAAMLLLAIGGWVWFSRTGGAELAFAEVMQQVAQTNTVQATLINNPDDHYRRSTAKLMIKGTRGRIEGDDDNIDISDDRTGDELNLYPKTMTAVHSVEKDGGMDFYAELRRIGDSAPMPIGRKMVDGRMLNGFSGTTEFFGLNNVPADVWVDPGTKLPVRIEILSAAGGPAVAVFDDIHFEVPLADSLFDATPPVGYRVREEGGLTREQLAALPAATAGQLGQMVLKPGWGIGSLPFSTTAEQIVAVLGEPAKPAVVGMLSYPALGLMLSVDDAPRGLKQIQVSSAAYSSRNIRDFPGRTQDGVRIGSSRQEVEKAYGAADAANVVGDALVVLSYRKLGMNITLINGRVSDIVIFVPYPPSDATTDRRKPATMPAVPVTVVPLPANPGPAPTEAQLQKLVLKPGVGIGDLEFRATRQQVIAAMGEPQGVIRTGATELLIYSADGLTLSISSDGLLETIIAQRNALTSKPAAPSRERPFAGWTDKHIHIGSTRDEVVTAYGKDYGEVGVMVMNHPEVHQTQLVYQKLGLVVTLDKQTNLCVSLWLMRPTANNNGILIPSTRQSAPPSSISRPGIP